MMSLLVVTPAAPATVSSLIGTLRGVADILCKEPNALLISFHLKLMSSAKKKRRPATVHTASYYEVRTTSDLFRCQERHTSQRNIKEL